MFEEKHKLVPNTESFRNDCELCIEGAVLRTVAKAGGSVVSSPPPPPPPPQGLGGWLRAAYRFATDRNDFRRNLLVNVGLFAAGVWVARNLADIDLMAPQPVA